MLENGLNEQTLEIAKDIAKEVTKDVYNDGLKPVVSPSGELLGLVPRAVKAALAPVEKWILHREYNVAETKKLLEEKLKDTPPELIEPPEAHIAVPAMQYISYCMDNDELRDMYANLLANSMNKVVKNGVHPSFVEIIKQLCPDEAKFLKYMANHRRIPTIGLRYVKNKNEGIDILRDFSLVPQFAGCEQKLESEKYIDNLVRLGLLQRSTGFSSLVDKSIYEPLKNDPYVLSYNSVAKANASGFEKCTFEEGFVDLTAFGKSFCDICLANRTVVVIKSGDK